MKHYIPLVLLICGMCIAAFSIGNVYVKDVTIQPPDDKEERSWKPIFEGALGDLDISWSSGNTSILGIWVVNHSNNEFAYGNHSGATTDTYHNPMNDTATFNSSVNVMGYAQSDDFDIEIAHSTAFDFIVRVRANATNAADGDWFNDTWVSCNITMGPGFGYATTTSVNMTAAVTHNVSGDPFIYINFYVNGTEYVSQEWDHSTRTTGTGYQISRDNRTYLPWINLSCYY